MLNAATNNIAKTNTYSQKDSAKYVGSLNNEPCKWE